MAATCCAPPWEPCEQLFRSHPLWLELAAAGAGTAAERGPPPAAAGSRPWRVSEGCRSVSQDGTKRRGGCPRPSAARLRSPRFDHEPPGYSRGVRAVPGRGAGTALWSPACPRGACSHRSRLARVSNAGRDADLRHRVRLSRPQVESTASGCFAAQDSRPALSPGLTPVAGLHPPTRNRARAPCEPGRLTLSGVRPASLDGALSRQPHTAKGVTW